MNYINCAAWLGNAFVWGLYAHNTFMTVTSIVVAAGAAYAARHFD